LLQMSSFHSAGSAVMAGKRRQDTKKVPTKNTRWTKTYDSATQTVTGGYMKTLLAALALIALPAQADVIYQWQGKCALGCSGTAHAVLTLSDTYVPGDELDLNSTTFLINLFYQDSDDTRNMPGATPFQRGQDFETRFADSFLPELSGPGPLNLWVNDQTFSSFSDGNWVFAFGSIGFGHHTARGTDGNFTLQTAAPVDEPSTALLALFGLLGFCGIWLKEKRRG
jgi:hypothetical protein